VISFLDSLLMFSRILTRLKGKEKLMMQMSHPSPDVQKQALLAVQKLMVTNWSSLQK
jgi:hypothetical protein